MRKKARFPEISAGGRPEMALGKRPPGSKAPAVGNLDQEDVVSGCHQQVAEVAAKPEIAGVSVIRPVLGPDEIEKGAGKVFPAKDDRAAQRLDVESGISEREGSGRAEAVRVHRVMPVCRADRRISLSVDAVIKGFGLSELLEPAVSPDGEEGLDISLECKPGRESPIEPQFGGDDPLVESAENVAAGEGRRHQRILQILNPLNWIGFPGGGRPRRTTV